MRPSATMLTFLVYIRLSTSSLYASFPSWPETLDCILSQTKFLTLPPNPIFENSPYRQLILINDAYSRWSTGNRGRATSAEEVIEVAGSNHAIGVILNLAWGPNNFSPSMIWSWRTRSNSQTGLGAELLLPVEFAFCFCCICLFFILLLSSLPPFSFFFWAVLSLGHCDIFSNMVLVGVGCFFSLDFFRN